MKSIVSFIAGLLLLGTQAQAAPAHQHHGDHPSVHGMLMVGTSQVYLSHLPMFHSPHDYQVLLEVELSAAGKAAYLQNQATSDETVYTLVPEVFVLPEMIQNPKPFSAQIFKGHFERGGQMIADKVTVTVKNVLYFKKFLASEVKPARGSYILFGNSTEQFLAHTIVAKPDFDQVLKLSVPNAAAALLVGVGFVPVSLKGIANTQPLPDAGTFDAELNAPHRTLSIPLDIEKSLYLEHGDLEL